MRRSRLTMTGRSKEMHGTKERFYFSKAEFACSCLHTVSLASKRLYCLTSSSHSQMLFQITGGVRQDMRCTQGQTVHLSIHPKTSMCQTLTSSFLCLVAPSILKRIISLNAEGVYSGRCRRPHAIILSPNIFAGWRDATLPPS